MTAIKDITRINLPRDLTLAVRIARFAEQLHIDVADAVQIIQRARKAFYAGERACSWPNMEKQNERAQGRFENLIIDMDIGYSVEWNGLAPSLQREGRTVDIPLD